MTVLVVGGYGSVGRIITQELVNIDSAYRVYVAGRSESKACEFSSTFGDRVSGVEFDVRDTESFGTVLEDVEHVVVCIDQSDTEFVEACLERGIDYVDVTATDEFFRSVEPFGDTARDNGAMAVLNVGLVPGVSNLLAIDGVNTLSEVDSIEIFSMLGAGSEVGPAGLTWLLEWMSGSFSVQEGGTTRDVRSLTEPKTVVFPGFGQMHTYRFNFADQHSLARTLNVPRVSTRACYEPELVTRIMAGLRRMLTSSSQGDYSDYLVRRG